MVKKNLFKKATFMKNKTLFLSLMIVLVAVGIWITLAAGELTGVTMNAPLNGAYPHGIYVFNATTTGDADNVTFYYNSSGSWTQICVNDTPGIEFTCSYNTSGITDGVDYIVNTTARNDTSEFSTTSIGITIDNTAPTVTVALSDPTPTKAGNVTFTLDFNEEMNQTQAPTVKLNEFSVTEIEWPSSTQWTGWYNFTTETEGNYTINVTAAKDTAGNTIVEDTSNWFVLDTTEPDITHSSPDNNSWINNNTPSFSFTAVDDLSETMSCELIIEGSGFGINSSVVNSTLTTIIVNNLTDEMQGINNAWIINCTDEAGNSAASDEWVTHIDLTPPEIELHSPDNNLSTSSSTINFNWTVNDNWWNITGNISGDIPTTSLTCNLTINGVVNKTNVTLEGNAINYSANVSYLISDFNDGDYYWNVTCMDNATNTQTSGTHFFTIDSTNPIIAPIYPVEDQFINMQDININFSVNTTGSILKRVLIVLNGTESSYRPESSLYDITCNETIIGSELYYCNTTTSLLDGIHQANITAWDDMDNNITYLLNFTIDAITPASFNFVSPTEGDYANKSQDWYYVNVTFTETNPDSCLLDNGTTNTSMSGDSTTNCFINMTSQSEALHTYMVWANDTAGNWGVSSARHITLDTTKPTVSSASAAPDPAKAGNVIITVVFTESGSGLNTSVEPIVKFAYSNTTNVTLTNDSYIGTTWVGHATVTPGSDGTATIKVSGATDNAINTMLDNNSAGTFTIDTIAPTVNMINSSFNTTDTTPSIAFNYTDALSSTASCTLYLNDTALDTNPTVANDTNTVLTVNDTQSDGTYTVYVNCTDLAGNIDKSSEITVIIDFSAPTATVTLSDPTPTKAGNVTFTLDFNEAMDQTLNTTVTLNGSSVTAIGWQSSTQWTGWYNFSTETEGNYTINVTAAKDTAGNTMAEDTSNWFVLDTSAPTATVTLSDLTPTKAGNVTFTLDFNEAMDQTQAPTVKLNSSNVTEIEWQSSTQWTGWYNFTSLDIEGNYTINVTAAKDTAGNTMAEDTSNWFVLDITNPTVTVSSSEASPTTSDTTIILGNATDNTGGSGIASVTVNGANATTLNTTTGAYSKSVELIVGSNAITVIAYDNAGNSITDTSVSVTRTAVTTPSSSGGGSVTYTSVSEQGTSITLRKGFIKTFTLTGKYHTIKGVEIGADYATFIVASTPVTVTLNLLESKKLDLDNDGYYDLHITLDEIKSSIAYMTLKHINESITAEAGEQPEEVPEETPEEVPEEVPEETPEVPEEVPKEEIPPAKPNIGVIIVLVIALLALVGLLIYRRKKGY